MMPHWSPAKIFAHKHYRAFTKPITNWYYNRVVQKKRSKNLPEKNLDLLIPDKREVHSSEVNKIRHIAIRILECFDHICSNNKIDYFLAYGTLLGAIRHKGFIPWDDDLDIMMLPEDFDAFRALCHQLPSSLKFIRMNDGFWKIMDRYSIISKDQKRGVALDIFVAAPQAKDYYFINVHNSRPIFFTKKNVLPVSRQVFEANYQFPIPNDAHFFLSGIYGDYMKLPPKEQRVAPHLGSKVVIGEFGQNPLN